MIDWRDTEKDIKIIEATKEATDEYGHRFGSSILELKREHIEALLAGKILAWNDQEYSTFIVLGQDAI